jgi:hypothetical protein
MDGTMKISSDENYDLVAHTRKGRRGSLGRRDFLSREASPESRKRKDINKIRFFECHDFGHYASQCPHQRGRGIRKQSLVVEVDEVAYRL